MWHRVLGEVVSTISLNWSRCSIDQRSKKLTTKIAAEKKRNKKKLHKNKPFIIGMLNHLNIWCLKNNLLFLGQYDWICISSNLNCTIAFSPRATHECTCTWANFHYKLINNWIEEWQLRNKKKKLWHESKPYKLFMVQVNVFVRI